MVSRSIFLSYLVDHFLGCVICKSSLIDLYLLCVLLYRINYALYEELDAKDMDRTRDVYR